MPRQPHDNPTYNTPLTPKKPNTNIPDDNDTPPKWSFRTPKHDETPDGPNEHANKPHFDTRLKTN